MRRRDVIVGLQLAASATTRMQTTLARDRPKMPRVGYLGTNIGPRLWRPSERGCARHFLLPCGRVHLRIEGSR